MKCNFLCTEKTIGGAKYIYNYSQIINEIKNYIRSCSYKKRTSKFRTINKKLNFKRDVHSGWQFEDITYSKNFKYKWFDNKVKIKQNFNFDKKRLLFYQKFSYIL